MAQIVSGPELVDCTFSGDTETTCFSITVIAEPSSYTAGSKEALQGTGGDGIFYCFATN